MALRNHFWVSIDCQRLSQFLSSQTTATDIIPAVKWLPRLLSQRSEVWAIISVGPKVPRGWTACPRAWVLCPEAMVRGAPGVTLGCYLSFLMVALMTLEGAAARWLHKRWQGSKNFVVHVPSLGKKGISTLPNIFANALCAFQSLSQHLLNVNSVESESQIWKD